MTRAIKREACAVVVAWAYLAQLMVGCAPSSSWEDEEGGARREALLPPTSYTLLPTDVIAPGVTVGETAFDYSVSDDGNAQVTVPIWAPPGRGGMQPSLALTYRSNGGQGPVGQGWAVAGLSAIELCRKNPAQDGAFGAATPEHYCLDGQRLVATADGYRTEVNGFDKIVSVVGGFEVFRRDGSIATYGGVTADAAIGGRVWALSQLRDRSGNHVDFVYELPNFVVPGVIPALTLRQHRIKQINWGSTAAPRRLVFQYEQRPDLRSGNFAGVPFDLHSRLKQIDAMGPDVLSTFSSAAVTPTVLKSYKLAYLPPSAAVTASRLATITECDGQSVCKAPLTFTYSSETLAFDEVPLTGITDLPVTSQNASLHGQNGLDFPDVNGDGLDDLAYRNAPTANGSTTWRYRLNTAGVFGPEQTPGFVPSTEESREQSVQFVNVNRSPLVEALAPSFSTTGSNLNTSSFAYEFDTTQNSYSLLFQVPPSPILLPGPSLLTASVIGDVDGDRLPDLALKSPCQFFPTSSGLPNICGLRFVPNTSGSSGVAFGAPTSLTWQDGAVTRNVTLTPESPIYVQDVDGDGVNELLLRETLSVVYNGPHLFALKPAATGTSSNLETGLNSDKPGHRVFGDFNGDGYVDTLSVELNLTPQFGPPLADRLATALNKSDLFTGGEKEVKQLALPNSTLYDLVRQNELRVADLTGDGLDDVLLVSSMTLLVSNGIGGFSAQSLPIIPGTNSYDGVAVSSNRRFEQLLDYDGDGQLDLSLMRSANLFTAGTPTIYRRTGSPPGLLQTITGGVTTAKVTFTHDAIRPAASFYQAGSGCKYPQTCVKKGLWVVTATSVESSDPASPNRVTYSYADGRADVTGRGWLGFASRTETDEATGEVRTTTYDNVTAVVSTANADIHFYPNAFTPRTEVSRLDTRPAGVTAGTVLETRTSFQRSSDFSGTASTGKLATSLPTQVRRTQYEAPANGSTVGAFAAVTSMRSTLVHDAYGNVTESTTESFDADFQSGGIPSSAAVRKVKETLTYEAADTTNWFVSRVQRAEVASTEPARGAIAERTITRTTDFTYELGTMLAKTVEVEPCAQPCLETDLTSGFNRKLTFTRDAHGNVLQLNDDASGKSRVTEFTWDTLDATFPFTQTNAKGHVRTSYFHAGFGQLAIADSEIDVRTSRGFDGFGRVKTIDGPTDADTTVAYGISGGLTKVVATTGGAGSSTELYDRWGRLHTREWTGFAGAVASQTFVHDSLGRMTHASVPAYSGQPVRYSTSTYDRAGRILTAASPSGATTKWEYEGLRLSVRNPDNHVAEYERDGSGRLVSAAEVEPVSGRKVTTRHGYAPFDLLEKVVDPAGNETTVEYDRLGRRFALTDVNASAQAMLYNGYGELKRAVDGAATVMTYEFDDLGRLTSATSPAGVDSYAWDTATNGKGQLASATSIDGITSSHLYDAIGRRIQTRWNVAGQAFSINRTFDNLGRVSLLRYPDVTPADPSQFRLDLLYTSEGALETVRDASMLNSNIPPPALRKTLWRQVAMSASGQSETEEFGNGAVTVRSYDKDQRLQYQETKVGATTVQKLILSYSTAGLVQARVDAVNGTTEDFGHDFLNRLTTWRVTQNCQKSELAYAYDDLGNITDITRTAGFGEDATYSYGGPNAGPQAVTSVTSTSGTTSFGYLTGGLQSSAANRNVTFTPAQLPKHATSASEDLTYSYDADHARTLKKSASGSSTTYVGDIYQKRVAASGATRHVFDVGDFAQVEWPETGGVIGTPKVSYLHTDHLGTPETVTGAAGAVVERMKHDPFGQRRHGAALAFPAALPTPRGVGFTGHEPDDEFGLINMRGRIYDPATRRFLTPDPLVHSIASSQALNRYAYVANSPVNFADPSGFDITSVVGTHLPGSAWGPTAFMGGTTLYSNAKRSNAREFLDSGGGWQSTARTALEAPNRSDSGGTSALASMTVSHQEYLQFGSFRVDLFQWTGSGVPGQSRWSAFSDEVEANIDRLPYNLESLVPFSGVPANWDFLLTVSGITAKAAEQALLVRMGGPMGPTPAFAPVLGINAARAATAPLSSALLPTVVVQAARIGDGQQPAQAGAGPDLAAPAPRPRGLGNIGSHGAPIDPTTALSSGTRWLGAGYREIAPGVFRSADGLRQFRMTAADLTPTHGNIGSHVHFEALDQTGIVLENLHLPVIP